MTNDQRLKICGILFVLSALTGWVSADVDDVYYWESKKSTVVTSTNQSADTDFTPSFNQAKESTQSSYSQSPNDQRPMTDDRSISIVQENDTVVKAVIRR